MTRAAEIIDALLARKPGVLLRERTTGLPYGWALWIRNSARHRPPGVVPASPDLVAAAAAERGDRRREPGEALGRWGAFLALWRQGWQQAPRDERPLRWFSGTGSLLMHLLFVVGMAWVAYLQSLPVPPAVAGGGGDRVQVGFVAREGDGQAGAVDGPASDGPADAAGTPSASALPADAAAAPPDTGSSTTAAAEPVVDQSSFSFLDIPVPTPPDAAPMPPLEAETPQPEQPVQVTVVDVPTRAHVLPPTTPRAMPDAELRVRDVPLVIAPQVQAPLARAVDAPVPVLREPQLRQRAVETPPEVEIPPLQAPVARAVDVPAPALRDPQLRQREIETPPEIQLPPLRAPASAQVAAPALREQQVRQREIETAPEIQVPELRMAAAAPAVPERRLPDAAVRERQVAEPTAAEAPAPARPQAAAPSPPASTSVTPSSASASTPGRQEASPPGARAAPAASASAPGPASADDWSRSARNDEWGEAGRGETAGLFDGEGRARLPDAAPGPGAAERGAPGGDNDRWTESRIAQSGTWTQRPADDVGGTRFDQYWVPNESLLADWVRRGVRNMSIPIPGSSKRITCVISLLQLGGGCGVSDPNMNEQPAVARPPPDVPFKPELQQDNGSVRPGG